MKRVPVNMVWHTLAGPHASYTIGTQEARRYAPGFPAIAGFRDIENPDFRALEPYAAIGEYLHVDGWTGAAPAGWRIESEAAMCRMAWKASTPAVDDALDIVPLGPQHASAAFELVALTRPGPPGARMLELGEYVGVLDGQRLAAMAGLRPSADGFCEISGVCTHPDYRGKGLAGGLVAMLAERGLRRNETPLLRVFRNNTDAMRLYRRMGFEIYGESVARAMRRW
jgi:ribosomal protein S18 acetylase RimI-like enzyme